MISLYHTERVKVNTLMNVYKKIKALMGCTLKDSFKFNRI